MAAEQRPIMAPRAELSGPAKLLVVVCSVQLAVGLLAVLLSDGLALASMLPILLAVCIGALAWMESLRVRWELGMRRLELRERGGAGRPASK